GLISSLTRDLAAGGGVLLRGGTVLGGDARPHGFDVALEREIVAARAVVKAAGLFADEVSAALGGERFTVYPCRGEYAELRRSRAGWVNGLVYPLPDTEGHTLGIHLTKTVGGSVLLGPTTRFQSGKDD